jgi:hypothetical protein
VEIGEAGLLRPLIALRLGSYAPSTETTFREVLRAPPFVLLDEGERWSISGLAGRLWAPDADFAALTTAEQFRAFAEPGLAKVAMLVRVLPREASRSEIEVLARVWCTSDEARARFAPLWALVAPFARLIPGQALEPAVRAAEDDE